MNKGTIQTAIQLFDQIMTGNMILIDFYIQNYPQTLIELTDILISTNQLEEMLAYYPQMNEFIQNKNIKINDYSSMIFKSKNRDMIHDMDHIILPSALSFKLIEKESSEIRILLEKLLIASVSIDIELDKLNCFLKSDYVETINVILEWR